MLYYEKSEKEMAQKTINARISLRADTAANFASVNPVLLKNELAIEKDTGKKKLGDGSSRYSVLPYLEKTNWSEIENIPSSFNPAEHAHNYAGSSSAGGAATSANKINTNAGSKTQPVYFESGIPKATTYTLNASVPENAKFTDTVYTHPSYTAKTSGLYKVTVDSTGHVSATSAVVKSDITDLGIPAQDTKYTHPSTHAASMITGLATVATSGKYSDLSGTPTIPTTLPANGGNADTVNSHTVESNVPADAKFTDTVYTLPNATSSVLGGVKVGTNISVSNGTISVANGSTSAKGIVQLSSATNSTSTSLAATASAVKAAYDLANKKQSPSTTIAGYGITDAYTKTEINNKFSTANEFAIAVITE